MHVTTNANQSLSPPKLHTTDATVLVLQFTLQANKHPMGCEAQLAWKYLFTRSFWWVILMRTDIVSGVQSGSYIRLCTQDYKSLVQHLRFLSLWLTLSSSVLSNGYTSKCLGPHWSKPPFLIFWHSGTVALRTELQSARMSKKNFKRVG